jgi:hypothetical protein
MTRVYYPVVYKDFELEYDLVSRICTYLIHSAFVHDRLVNVWGDNIQVDIDRRQGGGLGETCTVSSNCDVRTL